MSHNRTRTLKYHRWLLCATLLLAVSPCPAEEGHYADIERRKATIDRLQDLLRIREAELKLEQLALERKNIQRQAEPATKPQPARDSTTLTPRKPAPAPRAMAVSDGQLVEIFDDLVVIRLGKQSHELRKGDTLLEWTLREIGADFVRLQRGGQKLKLDLALPAQP